MFNARFTHAWGTLVKQHLIKSERAWNVHWRASNARQTLSERIQRACSARGTYSGRISHTPETRRAFRKFLSMFNFFSPKERNAQRLLKRRTATSAGRTPKVPNALVACFERVSDVRLAYVEFCYFFNTPGARFTYTLLCDCCLNASYNDGCIHVFKYELPNKVKKDS